MEILAGRAGSATWSQPRKKVRTEFLTEMSMQLCNFVSTHQFKVFVSLAFVDGRLGPILSSAAMCFNTLKLADG